MTLAGLSPDQFKRLIMSVGSHRGARPMSPFDVAEALERSIQSGETAFSCAAALHLESSSMIGRFRRLLNLNSEIQHLVNWGFAPGTIPFTAASEISRLSSEDQKLIARAALAYQLNSGAIKEVVQLKQRSNRPIESCIDTVIQARPEIRKHHVLIGLITNKDLRDELTLMSQPERDAALARALSELYPSLTGHSWRLGKQRFSVVGSDEVQKTLTKSGQDFESLINRQLESVLSPA